MRVRKNEFRALNKWNDGSVRQVYTSFFAVIVFQKLFLKKISPLNGTFYFHLKFLFPS